MRLFQEMFRTFHLDKVEWVPLAGWMERMYRVFPRLPGAIMSPPAFVSELIGPNRYVTLATVLPLRASRAYPWGSFS